MKSLGRFFICCARLFWGRVAPKIDHLFLKSDLSLVWLRLEPFMVRHTLKAIFVVMPTVRPVLAVLGQPQIEKPIVRFVAIDVVHLLGRALSRHVEPRKAMGRAMLPINFKVYVPPVVQGSRPLTHTDFRARLCPLEHAGVGVVVEYF